MASAKAISHPEEKCQESRRIYSIFLSYASLTDRPRPGQGAGWVSYLKECIKYYLTIRLGMEPRIFFDQESMRPGDTLTPTIRKALDESKVFVAVLAPPYWESVWCPKELLYFASGERPILKVVLLPCSDPREPERLADALEARFFKSTGHGDFIWLDPALDVAEFEKKVAELNGHLGQYFPLKSQVVRKRPEDFLYLHSTSGAAEAEADFWFRVVDEFRGRLKNVPAPGDPVVAAFLLDPGLSDQEAAAAVEKLQLLRARKAPIFVWMGERPWESARLEQLPELRSELEALPRVVNTLQEFVRRILEPPLVSLDQPRPAVYLHLLRSDTHSVGQGLELLDWLFENVGECHSSLDQDEQLDPLSCKFHIVLFDTAEPGWVENKMPLRPEMDNTIVFITGKPTAWKRVFVNDRARVLRTLEEVKMRVQEWKLSSDV